MPKKIPKTNILLILFFSSGAAGLLYEIVWTRQLLLVFGNTTHSIVAVIATFLGGLAIGNFLFGARTDRMSAIELIRLYARLEFGVALTAFLSLPILNYVVPVYAALTDAPSPTVGLIILKFILAALTLLGPTILMGGTLPALVSFAKRHKQFEGEGISLLYAVNTSGAILGVLAASLILIELLGLTWTILTGVAINVAVGAVALTLVKEPSRQKSAKAPSEPAFKLGAEEKSILVIYLMSGLTAIAYQVLWTRLLTPKTGTFVYAFSAILAVYLFGIAFGSWLFHRYLEAPRNRGYLFGLSQLGIGVCALLSILFVRFDFGGSFMTMILVVVPATILMGISFPLVVLLVGGDKNPGKSVGHVYSANTVGSIIGAFSSSFLFIPVVGTVRSLFLLGLVNLILAISIFRLFKKQLQKKQQPVRTLANALGVAILLLILTGQWDHFRAGAMQGLMNEVKDEGLEYRFLEDEVASVLAFTDATKQTPYLYIDGVPTTLKVTETKLMAHLPIAIHPQPADMLIVAFGMGSTFRSALMHDINVDVVELCPSVPKMFDLFHLNAAEVLENRRGRIIINDGRNYVLLTRKNYDIVTIDPPPPFNAAGTTVLYAKEFYEQIVEKLNEGGIVCQWIFFGSRHDDLAMAMKSFFEVFPHVSIFRAVTKGIGGAFLIGSLTPFEIDDRRLSAVFDATVVKNDLAETGQTIGARNIRDIYVGTSQDLQQAYEDIAPVTDDRPRTEYYILRHTFAGVSGQTSVQLFPWLQQRTPAGGGSE
jgi:spermidine synthase